MSRPLVLCYHAVSDTWRHLLSVSAEALEAQLRVLLGRGYRPVGAAYIGQGRPVHNAYLEALTELGPLGLALFVLVIAMTAWYLVRVFRRARAAGDDVTRIVSATLLLGLLSLAVSLGFLSIELNKPLWIIVGLTIALERMSVQREAEGAADRVRGRSEPVPAAEPEPA